MIRKRQLILFLLSVLILAACGGDGAPAPSPTVPATAVSPTATPDPGNALRVGVSTDSPPFVFTDNGEPAGFDIELLNAIAASSDLELSYVPTNWGGIFEDLSAGRLDLVVSAATVTPDRQKLVNFSAPYFNAGLGLAAPPGSAVTGPADLEDKRVAVQQATTGELWVEQHSGAISVPFRDANAAFTALDRGEVAAIVHDQLILSNLKRENPDVAVTVLPQLLTDEYYAIAVRPDRPDLLAAVNDGLRSVATAGAYRSLCTTWFDADDACLSTADLIAGIPGEGEGTATAPEATATAVPGETPAGAAGGDPVVVTILYGSEKREWLQPLIETYNGEGRRTEDGRPIRIEAEAMGSLKAATAVLSGTIEATVWIPASSLSIPAVGADWAERYGGDLSLAPPQSLARSPVVLAIWRPMAEALGWPQQPLGWGTIADLSGGNWADYGHPEWGAFKFGHTHPAFSNSGLSAVLAQIYAGAGEEEGLTTADLEDPALRAFVSQIENSIIDYGNSTGFFADRMYDCEVGGPAYLSTAVLYENLVATQPDDCPPHPPLVAVYPQEGTFITDHPYVALNAPWVSAAQEEAALDFQAFLLAAPQQQAAVAAGFRPADPSAPLTAPLDAAHGVAPEQPQTILAAPPAEVVAGAQELWRAVKKTADIVVVMDISGSMWAEDEPGGGAKIEAARRGLAQFVNQLSPEDRLAIITFNDQITTLSPLAAVGERRPALIEAINSIQPEGPTRLYDAILQAHADLRGGGDPQRIRAIVVLSDGRDEALQADGSVAQASTNSLDDVIDAIQIGEEGGNAIKLFTIAYGGEADQELLRALSELTGGKGFSAGTETIREIYSEIATFF
jgi:Ca-activated chloride channel family protein